MAFWIFMFISRSAGDKPGFDLSANASQESSA